MADIITKTWFEQQPPDLQCRIRLWAEVDNMILGGKPRHWWYEINHQPELRYSEET